MTNGLGSPPAQLYTHTDGVLPAWVARGLAAAPPSADIDAAPTTDVDVCDSPSRLDRAPPGGAAHTIYARFGGRQAVDEWLASGESRTRLER